MNRIITAVLTMIVLAAAFTGCASDKDGSTLDSTATSPSSVTQKAGDSTTKSRADEAMDDAGENLSEAGDDVSRRADEVGDDIGEGIDDAADGAAGAVDEAGDAVSDALD